MSKDRKELNDDELDAVTGGGFLLDWLFGKKTQKNQTNADTRTSESDACDKYIHMVGMPNLYRCGSCKYFHKLGNSGVCNNEEGNNKNQKTTML